MRCLLLAALAPVILAAVVLWAATAIDSRLEWWDGEL